MKTHKLINPNDPKVTALQSRQHTSLELIKEYAGQMAEGLQFDPCCAVETPDGQIFIWDGKHRMEAAIHSGAMLLCELEPGTEQEAHWKACSANKKHGLRRSNMDIQKAVQEAIKLRPEKSDREIGLWVGCDHKTVGKYRELLLASGEVPQMPTREVTRGEQEYQMKIPMPTKSEPASDAGEQDSEEKDDFETRLARCRECVDKYYLVKIDGVLGVTKIVEINPHLAIVRGVTYPYDPHVPFKGMACGTLNFQLEELIRELTQACWESSKSRTWNKKTEQPAEEPEPVKPKPETPQQTAPESHLYTAGLWKIKVPNDIEIEQDAELFAHSPHGERFRQEATFSEKLDLLITYNRANGIPQSLAACDFCETILDVKKVYRGKNARICRQCAAKAQIALLHPDDPEVIAESQEFEAGW